jgi:hypothetical protein
MLFPFSIFLLPLFPYLFSSLLAPPSFYQS